MLEIASIVILGIVSQWVAWKTRVPAILPLIIIGLLVGPISSMWLEGGLKWIEPIHDPDVIKHGHDSHGHETTTRGHGLFPGSSLFYFVSLAIGIILFEGGLTLKAKEIKDGIAPTIGKLISIGSLVSFIGGGLAAYYILQPNLSWSLAFLFGGLIIVTGPTVIAPILRNVPLSKNVANILKWEGILIDPIGALVAVLVYNFISAGESGEEFTFTALRTFGQVLAVGFSVGMGAAFGFGQLIKHHLIPHYLLNVFTLALVMAAFVFSDLLAHESGLLTVVVMGMMLGNMDVKNLKGLLDFKESLTVLLISILFILLSANMDVEQLKFLLDPRALLVFAVVVFVLRPLGVFLSTMGSNLTFREKLFVSWIGPRGIVAAGIASVFGIRLMENDVAGAEYITPLVFLIVLGTVLLNATTARFVARILGVTLDDPNGIMIVGAGKGSRLIAKYLQDAGRRVVIVDNNAREISKAIDMGLEGMVENVFSDDLENRYELLDMAYLIALTSSNEVNSVACQKYEENFGKKGAYRFVTNLEMKENEIGIPQNALFDKNCDFIKFNRIVVDSNTIKEHFIEDENTNAPALLKRFATDGIPLFIRSAKKGEIRIISAYHEGLEVEKGDIIAYLGKMI